MSDWTAQTAETAELLSGLEAEQESRLHGREALYELGTAERVGAGTAIEGLRYEGSEEEGERTVLNFSCERNDSRLRPGSRVRLSQGDPSRAIARLELVGDHFDGKRYFLRLSGPVEDPKALERAEGWVIDEDLFDLLELQKEILRRAEAAGLCVWLTGEEAAPVSRPLDSASPFAEGLEGGMLDAFEAARAADPLFALQGPPGSGKTHLLARLALHFAIEEEARVLVSAVSHQAIHQALSEIFWVGSRMPACAGLLSAGLLKFGASRGSNEGLPEGVRAEPRLPSRRRPLIAGGTLYAAAQQALPQEKAQKGFEPPFDVVLFDEAGQATLTLALAARLLGRRVFFIGDDAQMSPIIELPPEAEPGRLCRMSALSFIRERYGDPLLLKKTHRLNRRLCSVVSDCFYGGVLEPTDKAAARRFRPALKPDPVFAAILDPAEPLVFVDVPHEDCRSVCEPEALWAAALVRECVRCGSAPEDLGVIAPFRAQCNRIRFLLDRVRTTVATVERFQGQEREAVMLSLTSSQPGYLSRLSGFLFNPNRLNVAVSRARSKVVLLGSKKALLRAAESEDPDSPSAGGASIFKKLLSMAHQVDGSEAPSRTPELFADRVSEPKARGAAGFEPEDEVVHALYGAGKVLKKSAQMVDGKKEWVNEIRFRDGSVRTVIARLSNPPMRLL